MYRSYLWALPLTLLFLTVPSCSNKTQDMSFDEEGLALYQQVQKSDAPWQVIGKSVEGRDIFMMEAGAGDSLTMIFGGFHGAEIRGVNLTLAFAEYLAASGMENRGAKVVLIPVLNPDGLVRRSRINARGVDINRNFPTANWSPEARSPRNFPGERPATEPETKLAMELVERYQPQRIVSIHAPLEVVNYDGPAQTLAERMAVHNGYPVSGDIGYPTPGSFGNYAGVEKRIPTITLELPQGPFAPMWEGNRKALLEALIY